MTTEPKTIFIKQLGLAAFLKSNGCKLVKVEDRIFHFETDISFKDWSIRYSNSCCFAHDTALCELRKLLSC